MHRPATTLAVSGPGEGPDGGPASIQARAEGLYREHFAFVWRTLRRLGVRASSVDDATQDVFLVAFRKLDAFDGRASHRAWLFAIATRVAAEHRRRDGKLTLDNAAHTRHPAPGGDRQLELRRRVERLDRLLSALSPEQREVFVMADVEGFDAPEIAAALGIKLNTVYSRLRLGRRRFGRALGQMRSKEHHEESR